ncbi:MAG: hypothetical protein ABTD50_19205 [Polyangiaceae bacterium]|jgi:hypothetical protein
MACVGNTAIVNVGRLLEVRISLGFRSAAYVANHFADIDAELERNHRSDRIVIAADWRFCHVMSTDAGEALVASLTRHNPRIERSAIVASANSPSAMLQFARLIRESGNPRRRLFTDAGEMASWLGEVLAPDERQRLAQFLDESVDCFGSAS